MATPGQLVQAMAHVLGVSAATISQYDRVLAEGGLRSKGGRGLSAARVTAADAANLLIAILASPISGAAIKDAAEYCRRYGALPLERATAGNPFEPARADQVLRAAGVRGLVDLPMKHSFHDALSALIEGAKTARRTLGGSPNQKDFGLSVSVENPAGGRTL